MLNQKIDHFDFWQPVVFTLNDNPGTTTLSRWGFVIGSLGDQFASLNNKTLGVNTHKTHAQKLYFTINAVKEIPIWKTTLKTSLYVLSGSSLLIAALIVKKLFKYHLNSCIALTMDSPNEVIADKQIGKTRIVLLYGSLIDETTDAIVNAANAGLRAGGGVCGAIRSVAGKAPFDECQEVLEQQKRNALTCGEVALTGAGELAPKITGIVHAVGPDFRNKEQAKEGMNLLTAAYRNSLEIVSYPKEKLTFSSQQMQNKAMRSIAFPSISTGIFKAPLDEAAATALQTVQTFIKEFPDAFDEVRFVFLPLENDTLTGPAYQKALNNLKTAD